MTDEAREPAPGLAEEIVLIAYRDTGELINEGMYVDLGLAGAHLLDLALLERIAVRDGDVVVNNAEPTGLPLADQVLHRIAESPQQTPKEWIIELGVPQTRDAVLDHLVDARVLERHKDRALFVFPRTRYPAASGTEPAPETRARRRLREAVTSDGPVDARTAALCALIAALQWENVVFGDLPKEHVIARLAEIDRSDWGSDAVRAALLQIQESVAATMALLIIPFVLRQNP
jgi:hypothetical protein